MRQYHSIFFILLASLVLSAGCAPQVPPASTAASSNLNLEMRRLRSDLQTQQQAISTLEQSLATLENKLAAQEQQLARLEQKRTRTVVSTGAGQPAFTVGSPGLSRSSQPLTAPVSTAVEGTPTEVYLKAFGDYASGHYPEAIAGFETFLQQFPNNSYAANAQFWLADSYFIQQEYQQAILSFQQMLQGYPRAAKAPDALYKITAAQMNLGELQSAQQTLAQLQQRFPKSSAAEKARELGLQQPGPD